MNWLFILSEDLIENPKGICIADYLIYYYTKIFKCYGHKNMFVIKSSCSLLKM